MIDEDKVLDAALGGKPAGLSAEEAREAARLRAAYAALSAGDDAPPPSNGRERLLKAVRSAERRRLWTPWALAAAALLAAGTWFLAPDGAARVTAVSGEVLADGRPAAAGDRLPAGTTLETRPGAWVQVAFGRRAAAHLGEGGRLSLSRLRGGMALKLQGGALFSKVRPGTAYSVATPTAAAAVRGTTFLVRDGDRAYICLCHGALEVSCEGATRTLSATDRHAAVRAGGGAIADAGMEDHMEKEAAGLALP